MWYNVYTVNRKERWSMTHFEKLKVMSLDDMIKCSDVCPLEYGIERKYCDTADCDKCRKIWLESEVNT